MKQSQQQWQECSIDEICLRYGNYNEEQITRWFLSNSQFYDPYNYIEPSDSDKKPNVSSAKRYARRPGMMLMK